MPLSNIPSIVSCLGVQLGDCRQILIEWNTIPPGSRLRRVQSGLQAGSSRSAYRLASYGRIDVSAPVGQSIEIGRKVQRVPMRAAGIPSLLICEENDDVWFFIGAHRKSEKASNWA